MASLIATVSVSMSFAAGCLWQHYRYHSLTGGLLLTARTHILSNPFLLIHHLYPRCKMYAYKSGGRTASLHHS
jgi:hypothetical protein